MRSLQVRTDPRAPAPLVNTAARLELLEYCLAHHADLVRCAKASVDWLARHAGIRRAICLAVDTDANLLVGLAGTGVSVEDVDGCSVPLSDPLDPLVRALSQTDPIVTRPAEPNGPSTLPLGPGPHTVIPLHGARQAEAGAAGVLVVRGSVTLTPDAVWLVRVLGQKLDQIRGPGSLADEVRTLRRASRVHDRREALERTTLSEQHQDASDELQMRVQSATAALVTQNELQRRQAIELEQASRLKSRFLANMSHEFRTPLNAILGYTHMLLQDVAGERPVDIKRQLTRIDSNGRHLLTIIDEILDITRIEAGKMPMQVSEFNLNELVPEVITELDPVIARSKLTVVTRLAADVPLLVSDRQKVKQIVVNLLSNALKFTHHGTIEIGVEFDPPTRMASVAVKDTGIGIAPEHHEKIFEDFRQVDDSPSRQYGGMGLGLAICRRLANALGGRITLHSRLGEGSIFTLTIPAAAPQ